MKKIYILTILLVAINSTFGQNSRHGELIADTLTIEYKTIDYPKYGIIHNYYYFFTDKNEYNTAFYKLKNCLNPYNNIYHTIYHFVLIPKELYTFEKSGKLVKETITILSEEFQNTDLNINVFLDLNSNLYNLDDINTDNFIIHNKVTIQHLKIKDICSTKFN